MSTSPDVRERLSRATLGLCLLGVAAMVAPDASAREAARDSSCSNTMRYDPFDLYGDTIRFQVLRNGAPVGEHTVEFRRQGDTLIVDTRFDLKVQMLFVTAYRYEYRASDTWRNGCLNGMEVVVNDDGDRHHVNAVADGDRLVIDGPRGRTDVANEIYPTHHWNAGVLGADRVLNTITGRVAEVDIIDKGMETVSVNGESRPARRYAYSGELRTEVWYDERGRWVKMRFAGADGSTIEYVCETCARELTASR
jgi:hypothetical protein